MTGTPGGTPEGPDAPRGATDTGTSVGEYAGLGLQFAASIVLFVFLGQALDRRLGTAPWLLLICLFVGAGASFYGMYRKLMAAQARAEAARKAETDETGRRVRHDGE
jgi:F0F1-type ATP synthase assembly protein I